MMVRDSDLSRLWPPMADMDSARAMPKRRARVDSQECFQAVEVEDEAAEGEGLDIARI